MTALRVKRFFVPQDWIRLCFLIVFASFLSSNVVIGEQILTIGAIANGNASTSTENVSTGTYDVIIEWHFIDVREAFQIFRSVRILDEDTDIDFIVILNFDPTTPRNSQLLETQNKSLVRWGEIPEHSRQVALEAYPGTNPLYPGELCGNGNVQSDLPPAYLEDPYCLIDINNTAGDKNWTYNESVTVNAPSVINVLVSSQRWKSVFIIHENATAGEAGKLADKLSTSGVMFVIYNVDRIHDLSISLREAYEVTVKQSTQINFLVLCRFTCARKVLRTANQFDSSNTIRRTILKQLSRWLVAVYGYKAGVSRALQNCANDLDNLVIIAFPEYKSGEAQWFLKSVKEMLVSFQFFPPSNVTSDTAIQYIQEKASSWDPALRCKGFKIDTLLWTTTGRDFSTVGYVDLNGRLVIQSDLFPNTNYGYNKRKFTISTLPYPPFVNKTVSNGTTIYEGFCMDLLQELALSLNFTYVLVEPADQKWGATTGDGNNTWNGLIGQLQRNEVDMVVAPISIQPEREMVMDFSYPFYYDFTTVIMKRPDPMTTKWRTLVDPFTWKVLVAIIAALPVMTLLVFVIEKYNPYYDNPKHLEMREANGGLHTFHDALWYMYGALLCQGGVHLPDSFAGRTIVSCWWLFSIIIVGTYCGNLIAFLTVNKVKPPFSTLNEMVEQKGEFKWGTLGGTYWEFAFKHASIPEYQKVGDGLVEFNRSDPNIMNTDPAYHINRVKQGGYAWIGDKTYIELTLAGECELLTIKEEFLPLVYAVGFPNNSPHTRIFSDEMISISEGGLLQIWKRRWWPKTNFCKLDTTTEALPISIVDVQSAYYVCVAGIFLGTVSFLAELAFAAYERRRDRRNPKTPVFNVVCKKTESVYRRPDQGETTEADTTANGGSSIEMNGHSRSRHSNNRAEFKF